MKVMYDGVECYVLPDGVRCKLTGQSPLDMDGCPCLHECCDGDCDYYTEETEND